MKNIIAVALVSGFLLSSVQAHAVTLSKNTHWSGRVTVEGQLVVDRKATLTIEPGTTVSFKPGKLDEEGLSDSGMVIKGTIVANGTTESRITFTSGSDRPQPGDWGEVKLFGSIGSSITACDFTYGGWGLHVHDTQVKIEDCTFTKNSYGGIRLKGGEVEITGCRITGVDIGIRYWLSSPSIHNNVITGNATGIFCRQGGEGSTITLNDIYRNSEYNIKLGDGQKEDVDARRNWWGSADVAEVRGRIYDRDREGYIGRVLIDPVLQKPVLE